MLAFFSQYGYTILIIAALIALFGFLLAMLIRERRAGKSSCCGGCAGCAMAGTCHAQTGAKKEEESSEESPCAGDRDCRNS